MNNRYLAIDLSVIIDQYVTALNASCNFLIPIESLLEAIIATALESYDEEIVRKKIFLLLTSSELLDPFNQNFEIIKELTNLFVSIIKDELLNNGIIEDEQQSYLLHTVRKCGLIIIKRV